MMEADEVKMSVRIEAPVQEALKVLAKKDGRTLQVYVGRVLADHVRRKAMGS